MRLEKGFGGDLGFLYAGWGERERREEEIMSVDWPITSLPCMSFFF